MSRQSPTDLHVTAIHEAAHMVVDICHLNTPVLVTIVPTRRRLGLHKSHTNRVPESLLAAAARTSGRAGRALMRQAFEKRCVTSLAGLAAEANVTPRLYATDFSIVDDLWSDDAKRVRDAVQAWEPDESKQGALMDNLFLRTQRLVRRKVVRSAIEYVATELLAHQTLRGRRLARVEFEVHRRVRRVRTEIAGRSFPSLRAAGAARAS